MIDTLRYSIVRIVMYVYVRTSVYVINTGVALRNPSAGGRRVTHLKLLIMVSG